MIWEKCRSKEVYQGYPNATFNENFFGLLEQASNKNKKIICGRFMTFKFHYFSDDQTDDIRL